MNKPSNQTLSAGLLYQTTISFESDGFCTKEEHDTFSAKIAINTTYSEFMADLYPFMIIYDFG